MTDASGRSDPLEPVLKEAEAELSRRLREACEAEERGVSTESTQEIRRLEDALLGAAVAAEQTILVRRHMRDREMPDRERPMQSGGLADRQQQADSSSGSGAAEGESPRGPYTAVREFTDPEGRSWRAWQVTPRSTLPGTPRRQFLGDFQEGWICFEAMDSTARRRLASPQPRWAELEEGELRKLLQRAAQAPIRKSHVSPHDNPAGGRGVS
jgi:hypothetical protein